MFISSIISARIIGMSLMLRNVNWLSSIDGNWCDWNKLNMMWWEIDSIINAEIIGYVFGVEKWKRQLTIIDWNISWWLAFAIVRVVICHRIQFWSAKMMKIRHSASCIGGLASLSASWGTNWGSSSSPRTITALSYWGVSTIGAPLCRASVVRLS